MERPGNFHRPTVLTGPKKVNTVLFIGILVILYLVVPACAIKTNRVDAAGQRHGKYVIRWHGGQVMQKGRFAHGIEKGKWKHYGLDGALVKKEAYRDNQIFIRYFYPDGKLESKGLAYMYTEGDFYRYSWEGLWHHYDSLSRYDYSVNYVRGIAVDTVKLETKKFLENERSAR